MEMQLIKLGGFHQVFRNAWRPNPNLTTCPSSPAAREPIFVAILLNLQRKRRVVMDDVNVSNVREVDRML
jgi:hypothetical protein